jgi:predicted RND superfamily exporter protein
MTEHRAPFIDRLTASSLARPWRFLGGALLLALAGGLLASHLEIRSSFAELLPSDVPSVRLLNELVRRVGGDGTVLVMVEAVDGPQGLPRAEAMAEILAFDYLKLGGDVIRSVEWNEKPIESWFADHWPMFVPLDDLVKARDAIREAKARAKQRMLDLGLDDEEPAPALPKTGVAGDLLDPSKPLPRDKVAEGFARYRDGFLVHPDGRSVTLVARPAGTSLGVSETRALLDRMRAIADGHRAELERDHLRVAFGGTFPAFLVEYESIIKDVASTFLLILAVVLASLFLFYRELRSVTALAIPILVAVAITFGITRLVIGYLNTQTAFLGSIVVGNGINYGLIYLARLGQLRRSGAALEPACMSAARDASKATLLAALATSVSFGTLIIAANRGFRHFGFIGGIGMVLSWVMTFTLVPALMKAMERLRPLKALGRAPDLARRRAVLDVVFARPRVITALFAAASLASAALFLARLPEVQETNLQNLANDVRGDPQWVRDSTRANAATGRSNAGAIAILPSQDDAEAYCKIVRERTAQRGQQYLVDGCETLSSVVPSHQAEKLAVIGQIRASLSDATLRALPPDGAARARAIRQDLAAQRPMSLQDAPPTLLDRFREKDGTIGRIAFVRAGWNAKLELAPNMFAFASLARDVPVGGKTWDAVGENLIFADLLANVQREGPITTLISFGGVCALVALFYRRWRLASNVLVSLFVGVVLMTGVATLLHLKVNVFNFIVFPITFGIAVDYGANVADRAQRRGDVLGSLAEVGPAVAFCSWTSLVGYSSMLFSLNRALRSFGWYAMIGELTTITAALALLPAIALCYRRAERP